MLKFLFKPLKFQVSNSLPPAWMASKTGDGGVKNWRTETPMQKKKTPMQKKKKKKKIIMHLQLITL